MWWSRVVGGIGRLLVGAGVLVLLFVAYQLWGTGLQEARAQDRLEDQFEELLARSSDVAKTSSTSAPKPGQGAPTTTNPAVAPGSTTTTLPPPLPVESGDAIARLQIPSIGVDKVVVEGVSVPDLRKGPGHYPATPLPGQPGNAAIAGHRTTYGAPFGDIDKLVPGDEIVVTTTQGTFRYAVIGAADDPAVGHFIVKPTDVWVLDDAGDNRLTLTACHPKYSARQRIIVTAKLLDPVPAPTTTSTPPSPTSGSDDGTDDGTDNGAVVVGDDGPSLDEGLGGDPGARLPTVLWGAGFFVVIAAVWRLSQRWRRLPAYAVGALPAAVVMLLWFENLDRLLPAR